MRAQDFVIIKQLQYFTYHAMHIITIYYTDFITIGNYQFKYITVIKIVCNMSKILK